MWGRLARQGPHQVAQKSRRTTFPRRSESFTVCPSMVRAEKSGAGFPGYVLLCAQTTNPATRTAAMTIHVRMVNLRVFDRQELWALQSKNAESNGKVVIIGNSTQGFRTETLLRNAR